MRNDIRKINKEFQYFCATECVENESCDNSPAENYNEKTADDCKSDVKDKVEDYMKTFGIIVASICGFMIGILFFTNLTIVIWKQNDEHDEIGEVGIDDDVDAEG